MGALEVFGTITMVIVLFTVPAEEIFPWLPWSKKVKQEKLQKAFEEMKLEGTGPLTALAMDLDRSDLDTATFVKICKDSGIDDWTTHVYEARRIFESLKV